MSTLLTFTSYLQTLIDQQTAIGDFSREALSDPDWVNPRSRGQMHATLLRKHVDRKVLTAAHIAWDAFESSRPRLVT